MLSRFMPCSVAEDKFQEPFDNGKLPMCLFPKCNACHNQQFNNEMFQKFGNKIVEINALDKD